MSDGSEAARTLSMMRTPKPFVCVVCGKNTVSLGKAGKYCSNRCKVRIYQQRRKAKAENELKSMWTEIARLSKLLREQSGGDPKILADCDHVDALYKKYKAAQRKRKQNADKK